LALGREKTIRAENIIQRQVFGSGHDLTMEGGDGLLIPTDVVPEGDLLGWSQGGAIVFVAQLEAEVGDDHQNDRYEQGHIPLVHFETDSKLS
jgi:hypothetical protein